MAGIIALVISTLVWGASPPIFKFALQDIPPFTFGFLRFFFAFMLVFPFMVKRIHSVDKRSLIHITLSALWGLTLGIGFLLIGLNFAPSINVHVISAIGPIYLYFMSLILLKEKPHTEILRGMLFSLMGVLIIVLGPFIRQPELEILNFSNSFALFFGNFSFVIAMIGAQMMIIHTKKVSAKVDVMVVTGLQFFIAALTFLPFMYVELQTYDLSQMTGNVWIGLIYAIIAASVIGYIAQNFALTKLPAQEVGIYHYLLPVIAVIVAVPLLGEIPDVIFFIGALNIFIGLYISERHPHYKDMNKKLHKHTKEDTHSNWLKKWI